MKLLTDKWRPAGTWRTRFAWWPTWALGADKLTHLVWLEVVQQRWHPPGFFWERGKWKTFRRDSRG